MNKKKSLQKLTAMILSVIMVLSMTPVSVMAEAVGLPIGTSGEIIAFEELVRDIAVQTVSLGTSKVDLALPETLTATVQIFSTGDDTAPDLGETTPAPDRTDSVSGAAIRMVEAESEATDESTEIAVSLPVQWSSSPEYDDDTEGEYLFIPDLPKGFTLGEGVSLPTITVTVTEDVALQLAARGMFTILSTRSGETQLLGLGTEEYPLRIETAAQLADFAWCLNNGELPSTLPEKTHLLLVNDIDLSVYGSSYDGGKGWIPIGDSMRPFKGTLDGSGKSITGLYINRSDQTYVGLFGYTDGGIIKDLALQNINVKGEAYVGGLVGVASGGTVQGCAVNGMVSGSKNDIGGIVGSITDGRILDCNAVCDISSNSSNTGGMVGSAVNTIIQSCIVLGRTSGGDPVGGLVGYVSGGTVQDCAALNTRVSGGSSQRGRVIGHLDVTGSSFLSNNYARIAMIVGGSRVLDGTASNKNGESADLTTIQTLWTSGPLNTWNYDLWTLVEGKLPILTGLSGQSDVLPTNIAELLGAGTSDDPYRIYTATDLKWITDRVNDGETLSGQFFRLENDIDLSAYGENHDDGKGWLPIGRDGSAFQGSFDGNGKRITGLYINRPDRFYNGLFGFVKGGVVKNCVISGNITAGDYTGGVVGAINSGGVVQSCFGMVNVNGKYSSGGVVGFLGKGTVENCANTGMVTGQRYVGGVTGYISKGTVQYCYNIGNVKGTEAAGGISGAVYDYDNGLIQKCVALNPSVVSPLPSRVVGSGTGNCSDNFAWSDMLLNSATTSEIDMYNGADVDASTIQTLWTTGALASSWKATGAWTLNEGKLPVLTGLSGQSGALANHLTGLTGSGTSESDPYLIYTAADLKWVADQVSGGNNFSNRYFRMEQEIDLSEYGRGYNSGKGWIPIGNNTTAFYGNFDGNGKVITGMYINNSSSSYIGLFGLISGGKVKNLTLLNARVRGSSYVGGLTGSITNSGTIQNCVVNAEVSGYSNVGGLVGRLGSNGIIQNCSVAGSVTVSKDYAGGVAGYLRNSGKVLNCIGGVNVNGNNYVGGIAGYSEGGTVQNCIGGANVNGNNYVGGIIGYCQRGRVLNCIETVNINGGNYVGGITGYSEYGTIQYCAALNISISSSGSDVNRVTGWTDNSSIYISNYALSSMKVNGSIVSGGTATNKKGADVTTSTVLRSSFWQNKLNFDKALWSIAEGRLPYLTAFPEYAPQLGLMAYRFPATDSSDIILTSNPELLLKSSSVQSVTVTATGAFLDTAWPDLVWETSEGSLTTATNTLSSTLTVPAGFTGAITVKAKPASFSSLPGNSVTVPVNGDLEGDVTVSGTFRYGQTLTAIPSIVSPKAGTLSYQWMRGSDPISGASNDTYVLTAADIDEILSVRVTAKNYNDKIQSVGQTVLRAENTTIPSVPQFESTTQDSITLRKLIGYEYAILPVGSDTELLELTGAFQTDNVFTGLTPNTSYDLYQRIGGTTTAEASTYSEKITITTDMAAVTNITVKTAPDKTTYNEGEMLDLTGFVITMNRSDGSTEDVALIDFESKGLIISLANGIKLGTSHTKVTITHTASGETVEQAITVRAAPTSAVTVTPTVSPVVTKKPDQPVTATKKPDQPVTATALVTVTTDQNGTAKAFIPDKTIMDAITKAQAEAKAKGKTAIGIAVELKSALHKDATSLKVTLTQSSLNSLVSAGTARLTINGSPVTVSFDLKALQEIQKQSSGDVTISITSVRSLSSGAQAMIGARPVYDITVSYVKDGKTIMVSALNSGIVTISILYTSSSSEAVGCLFGVYVDTKGNATRINDSIYDEGNGVMLISTGHLSIYGIGYTAPSTKFTDIGSHWAKESIDYVVGRGLLTGTSKTTFSPDTAMTRGMLVMALGKLSGLDEKAYNTNSFTDVKSDSIFRPYIEWANEKGIVKGINKSQFAPERAVTREEIAVILANYAKVTGYTLPVTREAVSYSDASSIGDIYKTVVTALQQAGIIMGEQNNKFNPKTNATRAEVSTMLHRYIKLTIDPATAQGWAKNDDGQWMYYQEGKALIDTQSIGGVKYFFNVDGILKTGWIKDGEHWRYYSGNRMLVGLQDIEGKEYSFSEDGRMISGKWIQIGGKWYYFDR